MSKIYRVIHAPKHVELQLSIKEANQIAIQRICDVYNWNLDWHLKCNLSGSIFVIENVQANTSHSFSYEKTIREAQPEDIMIFNLLSTLKLSK